MPRASLPYRTEPILSPCPMVPVAGSSGPGGVLGHHARTIVKTIVDNCVDACLALCLPSAKALGPDPPNFQLIGSGDGRSGHVVRSRAARRVRAVALLRSQPWALAKPAGP